MDQFALFSFTHLKTLRPTLANEVTNESLYPQKGLGYILMDVYSIDASLDAKFPRRQIGVLLMFKVNKRDSLQPSCFNGVACFIL